MQQLPQRRRHYRLWRWGKSVTDRRRNSTSVADQVRSNHQRRVFPLPVRRSVRPSVDTNDVGVQVWKEPNRSEWQSSTTKMALSGTKVCYSKRNRRHRERKVHTELYIHPFENIIRTWCYACGISKFCTTMSDTGITSSLFSYPFCCASFLKGIPVIILNNWSYFCTLIQLRR